MGKPDQIQLGEGTVIPILYEDRAVFAIDKPAGWLLAPSSWDRTGRNLQLALLSGIRGGAYWAHSRNLRFLRFIHRLDAETSGVLLLAKSPGALRAYSKLFESRKIEKKYLAVIEGIPKTPSWICRLPIGPDPDQTGRMRTISPSAPPRPARSTSNIQNLRSNIKRTTETHFQLLQTRQNRALLEARPITGRTHQIRLHLAASGHPVVGDPLYGFAEGSGRGRLGLRAIGLEYPDPFTNRVIRIKAPVRQWLRTFGFDLPDPSRFGKREAR